MKRQGGPESRLLDAQGHPTLGASEFQNEGTEGIWLPEEHALKLTKLEVGWLYGMLASLDKERGENWPTAKPGPNREPIPTTIPRRICEKLAEFWK